MAALSLVNEDEIRVALLDRMIRKRKAVGPEVPPTEQQTRLEVSRCASDSNEDSEMWRYDMASPLLRLLHKIMHEMYVAGEPFPKCSRKANAR
jgi:hypothetical protein